MKLKTSTKMSDLNIEFWKKLNVNSIKTDKISEILSYSDTQEIIVNYFKLNNDRYRELIDLVGKMEKKKHGD